MNVENIELNKKVERIELQIVAKEPPRFIRSSRYAGLRSAAIGRDSTGDIKLTLWGTQSAEVELGDKVVITNGYCVSVQGDRVLSSGRFGQLEIIDL